MTAFWDDHAWDLDNPGYFDAFLDALDEITAAADEAES